MTQMEDQIQMTTDFPLDDDGFLRRECPSCEHQFKWYAHQEGDPDAEVVNQYYCPLCGEPSGLEAWWTPDQLSYAQGSAGPAFDRYLGDMVAGALKGIKGLDFKANRNFTLGIPTPDPLTESNDMVIAQPPCHPNEPVKVPEANTGRVHCLICGSAFAV